MVRGLMGIAVYLTQRMMRWVAIGAVLGFIVAYFLLSSPGPSPAPGPSAGPQLQVPTIEQMKNLQPLPKGPSAERRDR